MSSHSDSVSDVLLHPDALHCLKRKQLENLCVRLELKATGKKDELIARLEGYACAKTAMEGTPSTGTIVSAPTLVQPEAISEEIEKDIEADSDMEGIPDAGPSIRLITHQEEEVEDVNVGDVSKSSSRTVMGREVEPQITVPSSSSLKSIYPWKRLTSSSSLSRRLRNASNSSALSSKADPLPSDDPMTLDEFGGAEGKIAGSSRVNSIGSLKRWLSKTSSSSLSKQAAQTEETPVGAAAPEVPAPLASPMAKRKRDSDGLIETPLSPEIPVRRAIKNRPSRAVKAGVSSPVPAAMLSPNLCSPTAASLADFSNAATKVLEEMNARLVQNGKPLMVQLPTAGSRSVSTSMKPPASPLKSINSRTKGRFSGEHAKNFGQMDSIANHYAAKRIESASREWNGNSSASASTSAKGTKRVKIDENMPEKSTEVEQKSTEERAVLQRKLEMAKQRRKSGGRRVSMGKKSGGVAPRVGFRNKITGAVRDFVGAASKMANGEGRSAPVVAEQSVLKQAKPLQNAVAPPRISSNVGATVRQPKSKPTFDLQASLARRPMGYKPYSAKETVQLLQTAAAVPGSPSKTVVASTTSPIRNGWTMVSAQPAKRVVSSSSTIAFPSISPEKELPAISIPEKASHPSPSPVEVKIAPRRNTMQNVSSTTTKKTRSSISTARQGPLQADRLKRASKANQAKHQASMETRRKQGVDVQKAVSKLEKVAAANVTPKSTGRGTPRKSSARMEMQGKGRGVASVKRVIS